MKNIQLMIIDPQNDFCTPEGSLFVPGANEDFIPQNEEPGENSRHEEET